MTTYNKSTLATFFETGDVPTGGDFQNLIDSQVNIAETSVQAMAGSLSMNELVAARVSAGNLNVTGTMSAASFSVSNFSVGGLFTAGSLRVAGVVSAQSLNITGDVLAMTGTVYASSLRTTSGVFRVVTTISAVGSTQATAAQLGRNGVIILKGITDGTDTGFVLQANLPGLQQTVYVDQNASCNLYPCDGGQINALSSNAAYGMAGNTQYIITHIRASGYSVK